MTTTTALEQIQRELERAQQFDAKDPHMDWNAYSAVKSALLAVAPLLPPDVALDAINLVGTIDNVYVKTVLGKE